MVEHFRIQIDKTLASAVVPADVVARCKQTYDERVDDITWKAVDCLLDDVPRHHHYSDARSRVVMVVSTLPWTTEETARRLINASDTEGFGYYPLMLELFINNWPSPDLTHYLHVVLCLGNDRFRMHTAIGHYGGAPTARRDFTFLPFDLLTEEERRTLYAAAGVPTAS